MFGDVDETLCALLFADVPLEKGEVDITFERPTREWAGRLSKPTLNLFLYDIRERQELKDNEPVITGDGQGRAVKRKPPRRIDLAYLVTAWTKEAADEHRLLGHVLACLYRQAEIAPERLQGELKGALCPVLTRVTPADAIVRPVDLWGVLDNEIRAALSWVVTVPLDVFKPIVGPVVRTKEIRLGAAGEEWRETIVQVGGRVYRHGDLLAGVPGVEVWVKGTGFRAVTDAGGRFSFGNLPAGEYIWHIQPPDGVAREQKVIVPAPAYDLEI